MNRDSVTGAYARTALMERLDEEVRRGARYGDTFSLLVLDLDHFKSVNDAFGHSRGDAVLSELAARVQAAARASDVLFRYGGDEFVLFLPRTSREQATALARRLADEIAGTPFQGRPPLSLTASVGVAAFPADGATAGAVFDRADARMFQAKRGSDRVMSQDPPQRLADALRGTGRLVERADALERANRFLDELGGKRRGVLHLSGPAGSGRTRLLREVEHLAELRGFKVVAVSGRPDARAEPLGALGAAHPRLDYAALRAAHPGATAAAVRHAAAGHPLLVAVDDAGDLDRATLEVLHALTAGAPRTACVGLVHTAGPGEPHPGPPDAPLRAVAELPPLSPAGVRVWLRAALRAEPREELVDWLHIQSGGLPGAVHELLLQLARRGAVAQRPDGSWFLQADVGELGAHPAPAPRLRNLPTPAGPLVARDDALRELLRTLRAARLVTVCGPGGAGKTRLAVEAAQEAAERFPDGLAWLDAEGASEPSSLWTDLAATLALEPPFGTDSAAALHAALRPLRMLLVLDGVEDGRVCAPLLRDVLAAAPDVRVLVTARQRLQFPGEWVVALEGLAAPRAREPERLMEYDAVRLFAQRAAALDAAPGEADLPHVGRLAGALHGLPLAVEVAASQCGALSCRELAHELQGTLDDLKLYLPAEPPELRVTRAVLDVAWRLLPAQLRAALRRVSLFRGAFGEEAARRVADASTAELDELAARGLLSRTADGRVRLHPLVRDYARAKLDEFPRERADAVAAYVVHQLEQVGREGASPRPDLPELREAWDLAAREGCAEALAAAADPLLELLGARGAWAEAERRFSFAAASLAAAGGGDAVRRMEARWGAALVALDRPARAGAPLRRALGAAARAGDGAEAAFCLTWLARARLRAGQPRRAARAAARALGATERAGVPALRVRALCVAAESAWASAAPRDAVRRLYEAVEVNPGGPAEAEAWRQAVDMGERLLRGGETALAAVLLSRICGVDSAPPACASRAAALLAEVRGAPASLPPVPAMVIVGPPGEAVPPSGAPVNAGAAAPGAGGAVPEG
jgi:diguanylate cyclase (GGDEF)-like protein